MDRLTQPGGRCPRRTPLTPSRAGAPLPRSAPARRAFGARAKRAAASLAVAVVWIACIMLAPLGPAVVVSAQVSGEVVGASGAVSPIVVSLDKSLAFYDGLLGLKSDAPRTASAKDTPPPPILRLEGTPDGSMRWSHVTFPGTQWWAEPLEFGDVDRKPVQPRLQDPGALTIIFYVRDIDSLLVRLKRAGTPVVTPGGSPLLLNPGVDKSRAIIVKDPDDHYVQLVQPDPIPPNAPTSDVIGGSVRVTIADTDKTMHLYRDLLGFQPTVGQFTANKAYAALTGLETAQFRITSAPIPGEPRLALEFIEFKGVDRKPLSTRIYDPGATRLMFMVRNMDSAVDKFKNAGGTVVSTGGTPVNLGPGGPYLIVRDLNNFFIILRERPAQ
jgi:catechol 2,3-dioxygenase-like lactoylglutathione lyase family enzyme